MLLQRYLETIETINPNKIYVENVRHFLRVPTFLARILCEMAVVDKIFTKKVGLICPNSDCNRIIASFNNEDEIPEEITCDICEHDDNLVSTYNTSQLERIEFYQLIKGGKND